MLDPRIEDLKKEIELLKTVCKKLANYIDVIFYPRYLKESEYYEGEPDLDQVLNEVKKVLNE